MLPTCNVSSWGENKEGKVLGEFLAFQTEEKFSRRELWLVTLPTPSQQLCPVGVVQEGWTEQGGLQCGLNTPGMSSHGH